MTDTTNEPRADAAAATIERVNAAFEGLAFESSQPRDGMPTYVLEVGDVRAALERLKQRAGFESNTLVTAIDRQQSSRTPRFELVWQFLSFSHNDRVRLVCRVSEQQAEVPSCSDLWPGASFSERECYDMFGIQFSGHPDLRRLLMPEGYGHFPLRKDFPHEGIEPDRLYREWDRERRKDWSPS